MKKITVNNLINLLFFIYILSLYTIINNPIYFIVSNVLAAILIGIIFIKLILYKKGQIKINTVLFMYLLFIFISILSIYLASDKQLAFSKVRTLVLIYVLMIAIVNYIDSYQKLKKVINYFIYSGVIGSLYILITSDFSDTTRFGSDLGNVNAVGMQISLSATFSVYKIADKMKFKHFIPLLIMLPIILLTGSRKALLFIIINIIIIVLLKNKSSLMKMLKSLSITILVLLTAYYVTFKIAFFYEIIGKRIDNLYKYIFEGDVAEGSINQRSYMIEFGMNKFSEKPLMGYGIDNYRVLLGQDIGIITYAHNNYVELLVGVGILGLLIYYGTQIILIRNLYHFSSDVQQNTLSYIFIAIIITYMILGSSLVYYDSKIFSIIIALASTVKIINQSEKRQVKNENRNIKRF